MSTNPGNRPAFPHSPVVGVGVSGSGYASQSYAVPMYGHESGITKREYFAALAMQGLMRRNEGFFDDVARASVQAADALLAELGRTT